MLDENKFSGIVLARAQTGESSIKLTLFLKKRGIIYALAPRAEGGRTRFGGGTEPFIWGVFSFKPGKSGGNYLSEIEIKDDMIGLRRRSEAMFSAVKWSRLLIQNLIPENPDDELLANLYWNMKLLCDNKIPVEVSDWRFVWRWLRIWGIAPEDNHNFNKSLLLKTANADINFIINNFDFTNFNKYNQKLFANAAMQAEKFLRLNN